MESQLFLLCCLPILVSALTAVPHMLSSSSSLSVLEGTSVLLPCNVQNIENPVRVWKQLPSRVLFSGAVLVSRDDKINLVKGAALQIDAITSEYTGDYVCQISHHPDLSVTHTIRVLVSPMIIPVPKNGHVMAPKGSAVIITCNATGVPTPIVTWTYEHDGMHSSHLPSGARVLDQGRQLHIASVDVAHDGRYRCSADNDIGRAVHVTFKLTVLYAPEVILKHDWIHGDEGATVELSCEVSAVPPADVRWVRGQGDTRMRVWQSAFTWWLRIQRLRREDLGTYACVAENSEGRVTKTAHISGLAEPVQLRGNQSSETSFRLLWTAKSHSPIIEYQLKIRTLKGGGDWTDVLIPASSQSLFFSESYDVTGLEPGEKYEAVVLAHNDFGWNRPSDTFFFSSGNSSPTDDFHETTHSSIISFSEEEFDDADPKPQRQDLSSSSRLSPFFMDISFFILIILIRNDMLCPT